jgi:CxxC-x17-CxxC domain-containing protein
MAVRTTRLKLDRSPDEQEIARGGRDGAPHGTGEAAMEFTDRILICVDCGGEFVFTAGEQLFFQDKQFKNDPKRCKPCKSRRANGAAAPVEGAGPAAAGISRTETRTECSECGVATTVPFKPTQGRPVLCRQCFKGKSAAPSVAAQTISASADPVTQASSSAPLQSVSSHPPLGAA